MKIVELTSTLLTVPSRHQMVSRYPRHSYVITQVTTDDGLEGLGYSLMFADAGGPAVLRRLRDVVTPSLLGEDATDPERLWWRVSGLPHRDDGARIRAQALAAVDIALWDIAGKAAGLSLARLWGADATEVGCYGSGGWSTYTVGDLVAEAERYLSLGCGGYKLKVHQPEPAANHSRVAAVRDLLGDGLELMVDVNGRLGVDDAVALAASLADLDPTWFEEPVVADDLVGCAAVARRTPIPIATGENLVSSADFEVLGRLEAATFWMPDVCRAAGFTALRRIASTAASCGAVLAPHLVPELAVHVVASCPGGRLEYMDWQPDDLFVGLSRPIDGALRVPEVPGHGINLAPGAPQRYAA